MAIVAFGVSDELDFASIMIISISALGAIGFAGAAWADGKS